MTTRSILFITIPFLTALLFSHNQDLSDFENRKVSNLGDTINTSHFEGFPMIMPDGLTLFFSSDRPGGLGDLDIYLSKRRSVFAEWEEPVNLEIVNSVASDHSVTMSEDGHYLYFMSKKKGGFGSGDIYVAYREDVSDDFGWEKPENIGSTINTENLEACPLIHTEEGKTILYYVSNQAGTTGEIDIFYAIFNSETKEFNKPVNMTEVNSPQFDMHFEPVKGLMWSDRPGGAGGEDIWMAGFDKMDNLWKNPVALPYPINTEHIEGMPSVTHDLRELIFHSDRPGGKGSHDIYVASKDI